MSQRAAFCDCGEHGRKGYCFDQIRLPVVSSPVGRCCGFENPGVSAGFDTLTKDNRRVVNPHAYADGRNWDLSERVR